MAARPKGGIRGCLYSKVAAGRLSQAQADDALDRIKQMEAAFAATMSPAQAAAAATTQAARAIAAAALRKQRQAALKILATDRVVSAAEAHPNGLTAGAMAHIVRDIRDARSGISAADTRRETILGILHGMFADGLNAYRSKAAGLTQDILGIRNLVRELYGQATGDGLAAAAAKGWTRAATYARDRFVVAGGDIAEREDWRLPQMHDRRRTQQAGYAAWRAFEMPLLDRARMLDWKTGQPLTDAQLEPMLRRAYDSIVTDGLSDAVPGMPRGTGSVANRHNMHRFLVYRDAGAWLAHNDRFGAGRGGIYSLLTSHLDTMARDTAAIEVLGPNPDFMIRRLVDMAKLKEARRPPNLRRRLSPIRLLENPRAIQRTWDYYSDRLNVADSELMAGLGGTVRNMLVSAQMGSAIMSSIGDLATIQATAAWNGLPAARVIARMVKTLNPANEADRLFAVRNAIVAESWTARALGASRYQDEIVGRGLPSRLASFVVRAQGLAAWTQAGRNAFALEFMAFLAEQSGRARQDLSRPLRRAFDRYGITAADWDIIRRAPTMDKDGVRFVSVANVDQADLDSPARAGTANRAAANRLGEMIRSEINFAVPEPDARVRGLLSGGTQRGTFWGEVARSSAMYKSFSVTMMTTHFMRGAWGTAAASAAMRKLPLIVGLTAIGAFTVQMRQISQGKDPRDMTDPEFWGAAMFQSGGLGIFGDLFYAGLTRSDQSLAGTLAGPVASLVDDTARLIAPNLRQVSEGEETGFGSEASRFLRRYTPGTSIWYSRLATDRLLFDTLQSMVDPDWSGAFRRMERRARRDYGQRYFWRPGRTMPERGPDLEAALPVR
jgi:hypothetical protein